VKGLENTCVKIPVRFVKELGFPEQSRHVEVAGTTIQDINSSNIDTAHQIFEGLEDKLSGRDKEIGSEIIRGDT